MWMFIYVHLFFGYGSKWDTSKIGCLKVTFWYWRITQIYASQALSEFGSPYSYSFNRPFTPTSHCCSNNPILILNTPILGFQWNVEIPTKKPWFRWTGVLNIRMGWDSWKWPQWMKNPPAPRSLRTCAGHPVLSQQASAPRRPPRVAISYLWAGTTPVETRILIFTWAVWKKNNATSFHCSGWFRTDAQFMDDKIILTTLGSFSQLPIIINQLGFSNCLNMYSSWKRINSPHPCSFFIVTFDIRNLLGWLP